MALDTLGLMAGDRRRLLFKSYYNCFVALCLVGVWMMTPSSLVYLQNSNVSLTKKKNDVNSKALGDINENSSDNDSSDCYVNTDESSSNDSENKPRKFEDSQGDLPEESIKSDITQQENSENIEEEKSSDNIQEQKKQTDDKRIVAYRTQEDNEE